MPERVTYHCQNFHEWIGMRQKDVTSTEISALFGCSPYQSAAELWHRKAGKYFVDYPVTEPMKWGTRLQKSIALGVAYDNEWILEDTPEWLYMRMPDLQIGSSYDYFLAGKEAILEIKNVGYLQFRDGWIVDDDGKFEAPPHIELQLQHQMLVSGYSKAHLAALVGGSKAAVVTREYDPEIGEAIKTRVAQFWASIQENRPPAFDFARDAEMIKAMNQYAEPEKVIDETPEIVALVDAYKIAQESYKKAEASKTALSAQILLAIGDAEQVKGKTFTISAPLIGPTMVPEHERRAYRTPRVTFKKPKEEEKK